MSREEFEKLPGIKSRLEFCYWSDGDNCYRPRIAKEFAIYLNGAYYAYKEQQKKIDEALKYLKIPHYGYTAAIASIGVAVRELEK